MNETAARILRQLEVRKNLLISIRQTEGCFVQQDPATNLCYGEVDGAPAWVPVEHATRYPSTALSASRMRGFTPHDHLVPLPIAIGAALEDMDAAFAWVREGGGG
jgi:hypothetical protein